ncbi:solute carrier family 22 member 18 isoform X1, partial [Lates japonicus]
MRGKGEITIETSGAADRTKRVKIIHVVYLIAALDITWMFLQFSVTPYLAKKLGFDTLWFGYLQTTVGIIQLVGGPMFGRFGDLFGARAALSLACAATVIFFVLLAIANHPAMLFIHKIPTIFMHVMPASQMVVADLSEPEKRADALSKLGLCFGIGMIAGSTLGGHLNTRYGETFTAFLPDAEREFVHMQKKNQTLEKENELLKKKVEFLTTDAELFKVERQRIHQVIKNRDHLRNQLMHSKNELSVLGKKIRIQNTDLKRRCKQNEVLKEDMESLKKELQSVKQGTVKQKAGQQNLKEQLEQVIKEKDGLSEKWLQAQNECSELRDKMIIQQSSLNMKDGQCKEQVKQIHLLKLENLKLEKERGIIQSDAEDQRRELRKCEEKLHTQREKLKESKCCRAAEEKLGKKIIVVQQRPQIFRKARQEVPLQKIESLQKELFIQTEDLRKTQKQCEELKQNLTQIVAGLPSGIFQVMFSIIALEFFKLEPEQNGYLMAYFGIAQMVIQGGVIGRLTTRYSESSLLLLSIGVSSLVGLAQAYMQNVFHFCLTVPPMMFSLSVFNVITDSMLTKRVPSSDTGTMLGLCASVQSLLRT